MSYKYKNTGNEVIVIKGVGKVEIGNEIITPFTVENPNLTFIGEIQEAQQGNRGIVGIESPSPNAVIDPEYLGNVDK